MEEKQVTKEPMHKKAIFNTMVYVTFGVAAVFLIKNIVGKSLQGMIAIGVSLILFAGMLFIMKAAHAKEEVKQAAVSMCLLFLVFIISINSGESYSDDFAMYLAVIGLTGLYLRPKYTLIQTVLTDILLIVQYIWHPEKAENLAQFLLCVGTFTLASVMFYLAIRRGRAFINKSEIRAMEAEKLLNTLTEMGRDLQKNSENSLGKIEYLQEANGRLESSTKELKEGSDGITLEAGEVAETCKNVQERIQKTEEHIGALNREVKTFEDALAENHKNMEEMNEQMESVKDIMQEAEAVFQIMEQRMEEISKVTEQLNRISSSTTMLALNASIEAARAGQAGAGFAVVASKVQDLAVDSNRCSEQVAKAVTEMQEQVQRTTEQMEDSVHALGGSLDTLGGLKNSFYHLTQQFTSLYTNIEEQNHNINQVDSIFEQLKEKIAEMSSYSEENQTSVDEITQAMTDYRENVKMVIDDTRHVHELSASMINFSN